MHNPSSTSLTIALAWPQRHHVYSATQPRQDEQHQMCYRITKDSGQCAAALKICVAINIELHQDHEQPHVEATPPALCVTAHNRCSGSNPGTQWITRSFATAYRPSGGAMSETGTMSRSSWHDLQRTRDCCVPQRRGPLSVCHCKAYPGFNRFQSR